MLSLALELYVWQEGIVSLRHAKQHPDFTSCVAVIFGCWLWCDLIDLTSFSISPILSFAWIGHAIFIDFGDEDHVSG